jgi:LacI family transcriptional regulator
MRRPLLRDVAARAEVSSTTVSLVLTGKAGTNIPDTTKARVVAAAKELGYRPNAMARGLRQKRTNTFGLIADEIVTTPFSGAMIQGAQDAAWDAGIVLLLVNTSRHLDIEVRALGILHERRVDAIIYARMYHQVVDPPDALREVPSVLLDARTHDGSLPSVVPDEVGGAFAAVDHLLSRGHRRIGLVQSVHAVPAHSGRLEGFRRALDHHGVAFVPRLVVEDEPNTQGGFQAASELLDLDPRPTALFCFNDRMAMGAYRALRKRSLQVPTDVSVVGFDNEEQIAAWLDPPLTTVQLPHYEMGRWAAEYLLAGSLESDEPPQYLMPCPLVERHSVGSAPATEANGP